MDQRTDGELLVATATDPEASVRYELREAPARAWLYGIAWNKLHEAQRDAVRGRVLDERSYIDMAAELRCSESVVRQRVSRGIRSMRSKLEALGNG